MGTYKNLKSDEFLSTMEATPNHQILDVRSEREFKSGHFENAINIPSSEKQTLLNLDKNKAYFIHCRVGGRSAMVAHLLSTNGFNQIYNLNDNVETILAVKAKSA